MLYDYLAAVMYRENNHSAPQYHLGIVPDPAHGAFRWLSGAPYKWQKWSRPLGANPTTIATPCFAMLHSLDTSLWWWHPARCYYMVMQWEG